jgi:hypothetical protein
LDGGVKLPTSDNGASAGGSVEERIAFGLSVPIWSRYDGILLKAGKFDSGCVVLLPSSSFIISTPISPISSTNVEKGA